MKVLVVGSGGREHALLWKAAQSPLVERLYAAPGNAGMEALAERVPWNGEVEALADWALEAGIDLTLVGPEAPLVEGIADAFWERGLKVFGPTQKAAMIEGSKAFAKGLMERYGIPTARYRTFQDPLLALEYLEEVGVPIVIKDSGLAAGKGVTVAFDLHTAKQAVANILNRAEGGEVVIEEYLEGEEATVLALTDGKTVLPLLPSQDHKRLLDGDQGPMTGGIGAVAPYPMDGATLRRVEEEILWPLVRGLEAEGVVYRGVIYAGLMLTREGPKVLEFNARFGDPEAQAVLPLLQSDLVELALKVAEGRLQGTRLSWREGAAACVVLAAPGYPENPRKGIPLHLPEPPEGVLVFHAGTRREGGRLVSAGGRVLNVVGLGKDLKEALERAYAFIPRVGFPGAVYRRDIGRKALARFST
ncbi:phosphoribosylamine--glycine ligase [Thermus aquaticus]|uniref:Phosphoribosylamine--glycine ligase n=1 Tax=Thermus aquaticus (strain ATCC BAA-2747 / Y51MC23) TaxID=498848 RepID=A0ABN4II61_THEA5|nr:phosphoribosylamine--glycine ligase [Thermus aquaticus]ALJ91298.1 phosphoribosylamine--glycine ligase [Thermus aquaticus Y51MC23]